MGGPLAGWTGPKHTAPPSLQTALKWCAMQRPRLSVHVRQSVDTCDDIVVSEYEED